MLEFFRKLFATDFIPHGHCYLWRPEIVTLHVVSDGLTALAYFIIPFALVHLVRKRRDLAFDWMFVLFGTFILACGATHVMAIWTLWHPVYRLEGLIKAITALASVPTAFLLLRLVPQAIQLPSAEQLQNANRALEREVSERKAAEEIVHTLNRDLERRVAERTEELTEANARLKGMNDDLTHFAHAASHDLQEPLRIVMLYNQLLAKQFGDQLPEGAKRLVATSIESAGRTQTLLGAMRDYWQASEERQEPRSLVDVEEALQDAMTNLQTLIQETAASVTCDSLPKVQAERVILVQLFQNLVSNAIKYRSEEAPKIRVSAAKGGGEWVFTVADNGIGIAPRYRETVFGVFKRLHGKKYPGVGMGLALCRKAIERLGGRIWVEDSGVAGGSVFKFTIPDA